MKMIRGFWVFLLVVVVSSCSLSDETGFYVLNYDVDFSFSQDGWIGDFSDYPAGAEDSARFELLVDYTKLPDNLGGGRALMLSGNNYSDDLFMFIRKKIVNLTPSTTYTVAFDIDFASNAPLGGAGIGGSPGESVYLKVGATPNEPRKVIDGDRYVMNIDKGNQAENGEDMMVIGNIAVAKDTDYYTVINRSNSITTEPFEVKTNNKGELWLIVGTDSGFEGKTTIYYTKINVVFSNH